MDDWVIVLLGVMAVTCGILTVVLVVMLAVS